MYTKENRESNFKKKYYLNLRLSRPKPYVLMTILVLIISSLVASDAMSVWTWCLEVTTPRLTYSSRAEVLDWEGLGDD